MKLKIKNYFRVIRKILRMTTKALSVVFLKVHDCAMDRGLQILKNWFKNKIPHHPASRKWGLFFGFNFEREFLPEVLLRTTSKTFKPKDMVNLSLLTCKTIIELFLTTTV